MRLNPGRAPEGLFFFSPFWLMRDSFRKIPIKRRNAKIQIQNGGLPSHLLTGAQGPRTQGKHSGQGLLQGLSEPAHRCAFSTTSSQQLTAKLPTVTSDFSVWWQLPKRLQARVHFPPKKHACSPCSHDTRTFPLFHRHTRGPQTCAWSWIAILFFACSQVPFPSLESHLCFCFLC